jgi:RNA polymerase sigma factor (sigma-70 family)
MDVTKQITGIKANDERVLQYIYTSNYSRIEYFVTTNNGSEDDAKDIYQEAFLAVWRNVQMDKFTPTNETALSGYIYQIARNKWIDQLRAAKGKKLVAVPDTDIPDEPVQTYSEEEETYLATVKKHFNSLGEQCRDLLGMFYFKKQSMREIADFFSWTEASAKNNKYRCLQKLRNMVTQNNK